jgi:antitoxin component of MazEF toxin-antitoxin module
MSRIELTTELVKERNTVRLRINADLSAALGTARLLPAMVTIDGCPIPTTLHRMGGGYMMVLNKEVQQQIGATAGDTVHVTVELDGTERTVDLPDDLAAAIAAAGVRAGFDRLTPFRQAELVKSVTSAKKPETRARRIELVLHQLPTS